MNLKKKLTKQEISKLEAWAKVKKAGGYITENEAVMIESINKMKSDKWEGCTASAMDEAWAQLEELKKKTV
ncbi:hypothetical protein [Parasporobacterium paucivorans]|uniref:Uncharacterized protein n=1 Tax=Parasporobacterium paucivorans DSM 15970 TaxID=1122934 RepID=A0A1M6F3D1_9FIRM|nr:hypothetical protein [Parasporobacterium paucivorans]SHI92218.1 hypothetical protein SAMN02745691_01040 [Parasporobacterium paucivorans DSM 15970]